MGKPTGWTRGPGAWNAQWANVRKIVIARDGGHTCAHCGVAIHRRCNPKSCGQCRHIGHIIAKSDGGPDHPDNLICVCRDCNVRGPAIRHTTTPAITPPEW